MATNGTSGLWGQIPTQECAMPAVVVGIMFGLSEIMPALPTKFNGIFDGMFFLLKSGYHAYRRRRRRNTYDADGEDATIIRPE